MKKAKIDELPLYPEQRLCERPTTEQILRLYSLTAQHRLLDHGRTTQVFEAELTDLQSEILTMLGVPRKAYRPPT